MEARRQGPVAMLFERLLTRDSFSFDEAVATMRTTHHVKLSEQAFASMARFFPRRTPRRFVGPVPLEQLPVEPADDVEPVTDSYLSDTARALKAALDELQDQDRLILTWLFRDSHSVAQVARLLKTEQKKLYRRVDRIRELLRGKLEAHGVDAERVRLILHSSHLEMPPVLGSDIDEGIA